METRFRRYQKIGCGFVFLFFICIIIGWNGKLSERISGLSIDSQSRHLTAGILARLARRDLNVANAKRKLEERSAWLMPAHDEHAAFLALSLRDAPGWLLFSPVFPCDGTFEKQPRVDVQHDGGKWICGLQEEAARATLGGSSPRCIVYSFGSSNDFTFEERVHEIAPHCEIHTFDPTSVAPSPESRAGAFVNFHSDFGLAGGTPDNLFGQGFPVATLHDFMAKLGHKHLTILKIDAEGAEWGVMMKTDWHSVQAAQIALELHPQLGGGPSTVGEAEPYFTRLEASSYFLASIEPVTKTNYGQVEVVFLHKNFLPGEPWPSAQ
jgi:hypothetical protein